MTCTNMVDFVSKAIIILCYNQRKLRNHSKWSANRLTIQEVNFNIVVCVCAYTVSFISSISYHSDTAKTFKLIFYNFCIKCVYFKVNRIFLRMDRDSKTSRRLSGFLQKLARLQNWIRGPFRGILDGE